MTKELDEMDLEVERFRSAPPPVDPPMEVPEDDELAAGALEHANFQVFGRVPVGRPSAPDPEILRRSAEVVDVDEALDQAARGEK